MSFETESDLLYYCAVCLKLRFSNPPNQGLGLQGIAMSWYADLLKILWWKTKVYWPFPHVLQ